MKPGFFDHKTKHFYNIVKSTDQRGDVRITIREFNPELDKWLVKIWYFENEDKLLLLPFSQMIGKLLLLKPKKIFIKNSLNKPKKINLS